MEIKSSYKNGQLTIAVIGRVDAAEAANLQKEAFAEVEKYDNLKSIVIDANQMSFISSMGLRVVLALKKKHDNVSVIGVSPDVYNVFSITGFHKIISIEKALPSLSLEGIPAVEGMDGMYSMTDDTLLKVYPQGTTKDDVDKEIAMTKEFFVLGVPTAMVFDPVQVEGGRIGLVYERTSPIEIKAIALGKMLRELHEYKVDPEDSFDSYHDYLKQRVRSLAPYLGDDAVDNLLQMLSVLPDATSVLHGSLTLRCITKRDTEKVFTGLGKAGYGNPVLDLAHLYASFTEGQKGEYFDELLDEYYDLESDETIKRQRENIVLLSLIFQFIRLNSDGEPTDEAVEEAKKQFKELVSDRWDEILSRLRFKMDFNEEIRRLERQKFYLDGDVDIDWVAKKLGTNRHYVSDYFNKVLHATFNEYINNLRLEYAAKLLREGNVQKSQVCYDAGFNNDHTFRRLFKQKFGCLPSQYGK